MESGHYAERQPDILGITPNIRLSSVRQGERDASADPPVRRVMARAVWPACGSRKDVVWTTPLPPPTQQGSTPPTPPVAGPRAGPAPGSYRDLGQQRIRPSVQMACCAGERSFLAGSWLTAVVSGGASRPQWRHSAGAGAPAGRGTCAGLVIVNAASSPPAAHIAPDMSAAVRNPAASAPGCR
jgi:hypothetical protein